jgi:glycosyltransferase involved in cell wall biosynthesis
VDEMVDRVKLLVREPGRRQQMGAHAVRHAQKFVWDIVATQWQEVYLKMAGCAVKSS